MLHPHSFTVQRWHVFLILCCIHTSIFLPIRIGFNTELSSTEKVLDIVLDLFFIADIGLNFRIGPFYHKPIHSHHLLPFLPPPDTAVSFHPALPSPPPPPIVHSPPWLLLKACTFAAAVTRATLIIKPLLHPYCFVTTVASVPPHPAAHICFVYYFCLSPCVHSSYFSAIVVPVFSISLGYIDQRTKIVDMQPRRVGKRYLKVRYCPDREFCYHGACCHGLRC